MECKCPFCKEVIEVSKNLENEDRVECEACGEESYLWVGRLVDQDDLHEYRSDSIAAGQFEERAYGRRDE